MTCRTCRYFRRSVVRDLGLCALDRSREPLTGEEMRSCWQPPAVDTGPQPGLFSGSPPKRGSVTHVVGVGVPVEGAGRSGSTIAPARSGAITAPSSRADSAMGLVPAGAPVAATGSGTRADPSGAGGAQGFTSARQRSGIGPRGVEGDSGRLVEAPQVRPARQLISEARRRARLRRTGETLPEDRG